MGPCPQGACILIGEIDKKKDGKEKHKIFSDRIYIYAMLLRWRTIWRGYFVLVVREGLSYSIGVET